MVILRRLKPALDSHFKLLDCGCGGEAEYLEFDTGMWAAGCCDCGKRTKLHRVRHTVQTWWNGGVRHGQEAFYQGHEELGMTYAVELRLWGVDPRITEKFYTQRGRVEMRSFGDEGAFVKIGAGLRAWNNTQEE